MWFYATTNRCRHQFALGAIAGFGSNFLAVPAVKTTNKKIIAIPTRSAIKSVIAFLLLIVWNLGFQAYRQKNKVAPNFPSKYVAVRLDYPS